jgi:hypothetical protein
MGDVNGKTGFFLFSLDTELGWGYFDMEHLRSRKFSPDGSRERKSIELLLDVFDEFNIVATWAIVGHLFYEQCDKCDFCPISDWKGKYRTFEEVYKSNNPLWYGADIVEMLLNRGSRHEIAFHGYTHQVFDEATMGHAEAEIQIQEWLRIAKRKEVIPQAVCFPRNRVGHLNAFRENGFICYRGEGYVPWPHNLRFVGKLIKTIDHILSVSTPPVYKLNGVESSGLVNLPLSQGFFGFSWRTKMILDSLNLHKLPIRRMIKGVKKAAEEKKVIHIWAHPCEFQTRKDIEKLRYLLGTVADEMSKGRIQSVGMSCLASTARRCGPR